MLVISRKIGESFQIGEDVTVTILRIVGDKIRVGISAPPELKILRTELTEHETEEAK